MLGGEGQRIKPLHRGGRAHDGAIEQADLAGCHAAAFRHCGEARLLEGQQPFLPITQLMLLKRELLGHAAGAAQR